MPRLTSPTVRLHRSWLESQAEWGLGVHQDGTGLHENSEVESPQGFAEWVDSLHREGDLSVPSAVGRVHATYWWIVEDETYLGAISLRHSLNDFLLEAGGHIGYGIRPSARRRGLATWALGAVLPHARELGLDRVLLTCAVGNAASERVIESCGGVLEDVRSTSSGELRRYWIDLAARE